MLTAENEKYKKYLFCYSDKSWIIVSGCSWTNIYTEMYLLMQKSLIVMFKST